MEALNQSLLTALEILQMNQLFPFQAVLQAVVIPGSWNPGPLFALALSSLTQI